MAEDINSIRHAGLDILFEVHAVDATYQPIDGGAIATRVKIERDVDRYQTENGQLILSERRTLIRLRIADVAESKRGDTIATETETFTVDEVEGDNGFVRTVIVRNPEAS